MRLANSRNVPHLTLQSAEECVPIMCYRKPFLTAKQWSNLFHYDTKHCSVPIFILLPLCKTLLWVSCHTTPLHSCHSPIMYYSQTFLKHWCLNHCFLHIPISDMRSLTLLWNFEIKHVFVWPQSLIHSTALIPVLQMPIISQWLKLVLPSQGTLSDILASSTPLQTFKDTNKAKACQVMCIGV